MRNRVIGMLLLIGLMCTQFSQYLVVAGFDLNQKYISEKLCINKSRPWMHCNGRCYLMKKLKQAADKEKAAERETQKSSIQIAIITPPQQIAFAPQVVKTIYVREAAFKLPLRHASIFQPPQA